MPRQVPRCLTINQVHFLKVTIIPNQVHFLNFLEQFNERDFIIPEDNFMDDFEPIPEGNDS